MEKLKETWKELSSLEKTMVSIRNMACFCVLAVALLRVLGLIPYGAAAAWLLPVVAISQAVLSWKRNRAMALFFLGAFVFFFAVFFISRS